jgi:hypothetical protein
MDGVCTELWMVQTANTSSTRKSQNLHCCYIKRWFSAAGEKVYKNVSEEL